MDPPFEEVVEAALRRAADREDPVWLAIAGRARLHGLLLERIVNRYACRPSDPYVQIRRGRINEHLCSLHGNTSFFRHRSRECGSFILYRTEYEERFMIVWYHPPEWPEAFFVVPAERIRRAYCTSPRRGLVQISFPAERPREPRHARLDLWEFADAWHLLTSASEE